jgi:hypothetical protein
MATYKQTAIVRRPDTPLEFATIQQRPLPPPDLLISLSAGRPAAIRRYSDDAVVQWWPDGFVKVFQADGIELEFWAKPTLSDAANYRLWGGSQGAGFFKFNGDGSVYGRCFGGNYYWGPELHDDTPEVGVEMFAEQNADGAWEFYEDDEEDEDEDEWDADSYHDICHCRGCDQCD